MGGFVLWRRRPRLPAIHAIITKSATGRTRTGTPSRATDFKSATSTDSATVAFLGYGCLCASAAREKDRSIRLFSSSRFLPKAEIAR